jgi:hypothetical protein
VDALMTTAALFFALQLLAAAPEPSFPPATAQAMAKRMLDAEPYVGSDEQKETAGQTGKFFSPQELQLLHGNPMLGYWHVGTFAWAEGMKVSWGGIQSAHRSCRSIRPQAWAIAFAHVAKTAGLVVSPEAAVQMSGGCVGAVIDPSAREPVPGVLLELRVKSPSGTLLYRIAMGKPTVEDAMGAALDVALQFSRNVATEKGSARANSR